MATEYDLYHHPQLNPVVQQKLAITIQRVARICWKMCYKEVPATSECIQSCTENYIRAFDIVLEELKQMPNKKN